MDFGVWRPHGADLGRVLKFTGQLVRKEISGPSGMADWRKAWRVFAFAMEVLGAASRIRLKRYSDQVQQMSEDYPDLWWIVVCADCNMRKLHIERIRRWLTAGRMELIRVGLPFSFNLVAPWGLAFHEAARRNVLSCYECERCCMVCCFID